MNSKTKIGSMFLMAAVLVVGTISMTIPKSLAEPEYYSYDDPYAKDPYKNDHKKDSKYVSAHKIKCVNFNVNINGVNINHIPESTGAAAEAELQGENGATNGNGMFGDGGINIDRNYLNLCLNVNVNEDEQD